jgi:type VI secretion system secreted protein Hcp
MADMYAFLELEGIDGESQDKDYTNKIEIISFAWGATNSSSYAQGTGPGVSKGTFSDISIMKHADKASVRLLERAITGQPIGTGKLSLLKLSGETKIPYFEVEMENVVVTSWQFSGAGDGQLPSESVSLHYVVVKTHYKPQGNEGDASGNVDFGWNLQQNAST